MKKLISLALCLAMVLTIFTINASALVETGTTEVEGAVPDTVYINQQFDGADATSFGAGTATSGVKTITGAGDLLSAVDAIDASSYVFEFDIRKDAGYDSTSNFTVYFSRGGLDTTSSIRVFIAPHYLTENVWYTYRFTIDESLPIADNTQCTVEKIEYKEKSAETFTTCNLRATSSPNSAYTYRVRTTGAQADADIIFRSVDGMNLSFDNIKAYVPGVEGTEIFTEYPINEGNVVMTAKDVTEHVPTNIITDASTMDKAEFSYGTGTATGGQIVILVDLKNTVAGMPISVAASSTGTEYGNIFSTHILSNADIVGDWYTYRILFNVFSNRAEAVYRRPAEGGEWTELILNTDYIQGTKDNRFGTYKPDAAKAIIGYVEAMSTNLVAGTTDAGTRWASRNLQVIDGYAFAGTKTIADGKITLNLNAGIYGAASAILAVYDGTKLADAKYVNLAATAETIEVAANYAEGNKVVLYVWDSLANAKPIMLTPAEITVE